MRYLRQYNEAAYDYTPLIDGFIRRILEYKSDFIKNLSLDDQDWEIRSGYAPRKTISFDNGILDKRETLTIEDHRGRNAIRVFWDGRYQNDISLNSIGEHADTSINHIFDSFIKTSNGVKEYNRQVEIVKSVITKISKEEILENFADIIDLSESHTVEDTHRGGGKNSDGRKSYQTSWKVIVEFSKKMCNLKSPGLEITMDGDNQIIMNNIISATNRIKENYSIMTSVTFGENYMVIVLNAIDPLTGKKVTYN